MSANTAELTAASATIDGVTYRPLGLKAIGELMERAKMTLLKKRAEELLLREWMSSEEKSADMDRLTEELEGRMDITADSGRAFLGQYVGSIEGLQSVVEMSAGKPVDMPLNGDTAKEAMATIMRISGLTVSEKKGEGSKPSET